MKLKELKPINIVTHTLENSKRLILWIEKMDNRQIWRLRRKIREGCTVKTETLMEWSTEAAAEEYAKLYARQPKQTAGSEAA